MRPPLLPRVWALTWPTIIYNLLDWSVGLVDLFLVRSLGPAATAAVGVGRQLTFFLEALGLAVSVGVLALVSQAIGAGSMSRIAAVARNGLFLVLFLAVPIAVAGSLLSGPLLAALQTSPETLDLGTPYLRLALAGLPFLWTNLVAIAVLRGQGDVTTPLKVALAVTLLNVALNYSFVFGAGPIPALGVTGAALGTVAARACGTAALLTLLWRGALRRGSRAQDHPLDWTVIARILRIGVPQALANSVRNGSRLVFLGIVGASVLGESFQAGVGLGMQIRQMSTLPALAFQTALATLVGQALGGGNSDAAENIGRRGVRLLGLLMAVVTVAILCLADPLAAAFIAEPEAAVLGARVLRWFAVAQLFSTLSIGLQGVLMGAGDTLPALRYTVLSEWFVMLPSAGAAVAYDLAPDGVLAAWAMAPALTLSLMWRRFRGGAWKMPHERGRVSAP
jgi:putative MATE family efflux protein